MTDYLTTHGLPLLRSGYPIVPIKPGTKSPGLRDWTTLKATEEQVTAWATNGYAGGGVGVLAERYPGLDLDIRDATVAQHIADAAQLILGPAPVRTGNAPKVLLAYRTDTPFTKLSTPRWRDPTTGIEHQVEVLGAGQQWIAYGDHAETGQPYTWDTELVDFGELTRITREEAIDFLKQVATLVPEAWEIVSPGDAGAADGDVDALDEFKPPLDLTEEEIREILRKLDPAMHYNEWLKVGMALHHQFGGDEHGQWLWDRWSRVAEDDYKPGLCEAKWATFRDHRDGKRPGTFALMVKWVNEGTHRNPRYREKHVKDALKTDEEREAERAKFAVPAWDTIKVTPEKLLNGVLSPRCIVRDYLYADVGTLIAPGGVGKTTLVLHEFVHIVLGRDVWGLPVEHPGKCVLVTAEDDVHLCMGRLARILQDLDLTPEDYQRAIDGIAIWDVTGSGMKLTEMARGIELTELADNIVDAFKGQNIAQIVFDPLVSFGASEQAVNDNEQALITAGRRIRNGLDCCVRYVHHTGQQVAREKITDMYSGRGGSALADGARMVAVLQTWTDAKDDEEGEGKRPPVAEVIVGASYTVLTRCKLSYSPPGQKRICIAREGFTFTGQLEAAPNTEAEEAALVEKVVRIVQAEREKGLYPTQKSIEEGKKYPKVGIRNRTEWRRGVSLAKDDGRVVEVDTPAEAARGQKKKHLEVADDDDPDALGATENHGHGGSGNV